MLFEVLSYILGAFILLAAAGIAYQRHGLRQDRRKHSPPGRLVVCGKHQLHIYETGQGHPVVVFESGLASSSLNWTFVQQLVAKETCALTYDRAGIGWSEESETPRTLNGMVDDLGRLLSASGHRPPYVLVGHSFGGLLVRAYASLRNEDVAGLVLVDPVSLNFWADCTAEHQSRLHLGAKLARRGILLANLGVVRLSLAALASGRTPIPKAVLRASAGRATGAVGQLTGVVQKLPSSLRPFVQSHWSQAKSFRALAENLDILPQFAREARLMAISPELPLMILSAANATHQELAEREAWADASIRGRHLQIPDSSHWIQLEHPEQVSAAIFEMIRYLRASRDRP